MRYDIMVVAILAFIFATPRGFFRDRPPARVEVVRPGVYRVDADALVPEGEELDTMLAGAVREKTGREVRVQRREAVKDASGNLLAYRVWVEQ